MAEKSIPVPAPLSLALGVALLASLLFGAVQAGSAWCARRAEAGRTAAALRPMLEASLSEGDPEKVALLLETVRGSYSAAVYDTAGSLLVGSARPGTPGHPVPPFPARIHAPSGTPWRVELSLPLENAPAGTVVGSLFLRDDSPWVAALALRWALATLGVALGAAAFALLFRHRVAPDRETDAAAEEVTGLARAVAVHHNYRARATARAPLVEAVNEMLASIGRRDAEREAERRRVAEQALALRSSLDRIEKERESAPPRPSPLDLFRPELEAALRGIVDEASLLRTRLGEPHRRSATAIGRHGAHLLAVLGDADPSRPAGDAPFDLAELMEQLSVVFAARAAERGLGFSFDAVGALPAVRGDAATLRRALVALAGNAFHFTGKGHVDLVVGAVKDRFRFELRDTAPPLPAIAGEDDSRFAAGLNEVARQVEALGGAFKFRGTDAGNTFWFDLPLPSATR